MSAHRKTKISSVIRRNRQRFVAPIPVITVESHFTVLSSFVILRIMNAIEPASPRTKEMSITLDGHSLTIDDVAGIARNRRKIEIDRDARDRIDKCRGLLERKITAREIMYGVNTGIGELADVVLTPEEAERYQKYLLYSHAAAAENRVPKKMRAREFFRD